MSLVPPRRSLPGRGWLLFVFLTAGYALIGRGTFFTSDEGGIFNTTLALIQERTLAIGPGENVHPGADGRYYASREILPTLLAVPTAVAGMAVNMAMRGSPPPVAPRVRKTDEANWPIFVTVTLLGPAAVALTLLLLRRFVLDDAGSGADALWLVMTAGCATPLAVYAKTIFPQAFESAWLMLGFWCALRWRQTGELRHAFGIGAALGLGLMTRAAFLPLVVPFVVYLSVVRPGGLGRRLTSLLVLGLPVAVGGAATALVNWLRWGSPTDFGYHSDIEGFSTPALEGLYGLLASPGKGLFVYAPVLLLPLAYLHLLWRRGRAEVLLLLAVTGLYLAVYCRWYDWPGGLAWGPRFLVPLIAPWVALLGRALAEARGPWPRRLLVVALLVGALIQLPGIVLHPRWMLSLGGGPFSLRNPYPVALARHLHRNGPDDLWMFAERAMVSPLFWGIAGLFVAAAALLGRRTPSGRERWAVWVMPGFVAVLLCTVFLRP